MDVLQALATEAFTAEAFATEELATAEIEEEKARAAAALKAEAGATKASKETELEDETKARIVFRKPINHSGWDLFRLPIQQDTQGSAQNSTAGRDKAEISPTTPLQKEKFYQDVKAGRTVNSNLEANPKVPRLSLVRFHFSRPFKLSLEKEFFVDLFKHFQLNTYIFHLVSRNSYGLHRSPATENGHIDSFLLNTIIYMLAWSFNSITLETKAILMLREENGVISVEDVQTEFFRILSSFRNHIYSPKCLSTVVGIHLTHFLEKSIIDQRADIHKVEKYTGHGIAGSKEERPQMDMNKINDLSMDTGKIITVLANINRHLRVCRDITGHVKSSAGKLKKKWGKINASWIEKEKSLVEVASVLNLQLHSIQSSVVYHQDRAKAQMGVLQGLLTHEDATKSIKLAEQSTKMAKESIILTAESTKLTAESKKLAEKMKRLAQQTKKLTKRAVKDSSSMKTIAIMTMLFLPGTFFAALFSVPMLKRDSVDIVQRKFWVYWVCTIPTTLFVFAVWWFRIMRHDPVKALRDDDNDDDDEKSEMSTETGEMSTETIPVGPERV